MIRRDARIRALEILYQIEVTGRSVEEAVDSFTKVGEKVTTFTEEIANGVIKEKTDIDEKIDIAAARWTIDRMPLLDRNILRIAVYEILHEPEIPVSVSINEAVELAKIYGTPDSSKFVNGVLGNVAKRIENSESKK